MPQQQLSQPQIRHAQDLGYLADPGTQAHYQTEEMESSAPTMSVADDSTCEWLWTLPLERSTGPQGPSHPTTGYMTLPISNGSAATLGTQELAAMHPGWGMYAGNSNDLLHKQPPIPFENIPVPSSWSKIGAPGSMMVEASEGANDDWRTVMIYWQHANGIEAQAMVIVTDLIRNSMISQWPSVLQLKIHGNEGGAVDIQRWMRMNGASVARIKCALEPDISKFNALLELLRNPRGYATVGWEVEGSYRTRLLLSPLNNDLLCAAFIVDGIPKLPTSQPPGADHTKHPVAQNSLMCSEPAPLSDHVVEPIRPERSQHKPTHVAPATQQPGAQPQPWTQLRVDHGTSEDTMKHPQVDANLMANSDQAAASALVDAMSPPDPQPGQQSFTQAAQHRLTLNTLSGSHTEAGATGWVVNPYDRFGSKWPLKGNRDPWFGVGNEATYADADINVTFCDADVIEPSAGSGSGSGPI